MSIKLTDKLEAVTKANVIVDALQVAGGYIAVNSLDEIKQSEIKEGTQAYVVSKDKDYRYLKGSWQPITSGSGGEVSGEPIPSTVIASIFDGTFTPVPEEDRPENVIPDSTINDIINGTFGG